MNSILLAYYEIWNNAVTAEQYEAAAAIDIKYYQDEVRKTEDSNNWDLWQEITKIKRVQLTEHFLHILPSFPILHNNESQALPNIALVFDQYSGLAHEQVFSRNMEYVKRVVRRFNLYIVYAMGGADNGKTDHALKLYDTIRENIIFLECEEITKIGTQLNKAHEKFRFDTLIYGSTFELAFWTSLYCRHPNQKYRVMKYYPLKVGRFVDFAGGRANNEKYLSVRGYQYRQLTPLSPMIARNCDAVDHKAGHPLTFGSISRIQKTLDQRYQSFVQRLLVKRKDICYCYAGNPAEANQISDGIRRHPRAQFIGWVRPYDAICRYSIYLETFPWGGGDMSLLALSSGLPYLTLQSSENMSFGIYRTLKFLSGTSEIEEDREFMSCSFCINDDTLERRFFALCDSSDARSCLGLAWRRTLLNYKPTDLSCWQEFLFT